MTRKKRNKINTFIKVIFILIFLIVSGLYFYRQYSDYKHDLEDLRIAEEIERLLNDNIEIYEEIIPEVNTQSTPVERIVINSKDLLISNDKYIGVVELPSFGIKKPIVAGITKKDIASKVGWEPHSSMPGKGGNVVLAAHNSSNYFGKISGLSNGGKIIVTTRDGVFTYKVFDKFKVHKSEVWVYDKLPDKEETVTLITCVYPNNQYRWIVRGELISVEDF